MCHSAPAWVLIIQKGFYYIIKHTAKSKSTAIINNNDHKCHFHHGNDEGVCQSQCILEEVLFFSCCPSFPTAQDAVKLRV